MHSPFDRISRSLSLLRPLSLLAMLVVLCSLPSRAADVFVDCTGGTPRAFTTLQSVIDSLDFVGPHSITMIAGPCIENVLILDRQRITFQRRRGRGWLALHGFRCPDRQQRYGVNVVNGSDVRIFAPVSISNNTIGMTAGEASNTPLFGDPAGPTPVSLNGNTSIGVNTFGGHVTMFGPVQVRNNGAGGGSFHAGVRSDDNALVVVAGSGDVDISNNTGPGIEATNGGTLDLAGATIHNNTEDGVRLLGNSQIAVYPPNTNAIGNNRGHAILCDNTSNFFGDRTGLRDLLCQISQLKGRSARSWMGTGLQDEKPAPYIRAGKH